MPPMPGGHDARGLFGFAAIGRGLFPVPHEFDALLRHAVAGALVVAPAHVGGSVPTLFAVLKPGVGLTANVFHRFLDGRRHLCWRSWWGVAFGLGLGLSSMTGKTEEERTEARQGTHGDTLEDEAALAKQRMRLKACRHQSGKPPRARTGTSGAPEA